MNASAWLSFLRSGSADRREGGRWSFPQTLKNDGLYAGASALLWAVTPLAYVPRSWMPALGRALGWALFATGVGREATLRNLERALSDRSQAERHSLARRVYPELGSYLGDTVTMLIRPGRLVTIPFASGSREVLEAELARGRGVVFASAHLGPWEQVAGSLVRHGFPLTTVARETYDPRLMRIYDRLRGGLGVDVIYRGAPSAPTRLIRTLRRGGLLGLPMDLRSRAASIPSRFLGLPAMTAVGPARIALRTGAAVVVGTVARADNGGLAIRVTPIPTCDLAPTEEDEAVLTRRLDDELSARILDLPEAWVWMHPRWAT